MMLYQADFKELFSELFSQENKAALPPAPSAECVSRWEDDGGTAVPYPAGRIVLPPAKRISPLLATLFGIAAIHAALQVSKVAMPPARRILVAAEKL
tara:strand:- start:1566 stop:1856 length:291 start_codon:yes stop_codon:yes gene_type:complete